MKILLQKLRQMKHICEQHTNCSNCVFKSNDQCQIKEVIKLLDKKPKKWNMEEIEDVCNNNKHDR